MWLRWAGKIRLPLEPDDPIKRIESIKCYGLLVRPSGRITAWK